MISVWFSFFCFLGCGFMIVIYFFGRCVVICWLFLREFMMFGMFNGSGVVVGWG